MHDVYHVDHVYVIAGGNIHFHVRRVKGLFAFQPQCATPNCGRGGKSNATAAARFYAGIVRVCRIFLLNKITAL